MSSSTQVVNSGSLKVSTSASVSSTYEIQPHQSRLGSWKKALEKELENYEALDYLQKIFRLSKLTVFALICTVLTLSVVLGLTLPGFCMLVAYLAPSYFTLLAVNQGDKPECRHWMTYWVLMSFMGLFEEIFLEKLYPVFPFYYAFKLGFSMWCQSSQHRGSLFVYSHILSPFLKRHGAVMSK
mmetsp:Transcript_11758/g.13617  ORF Transcript_11758/g.13617 Transcript_11758/m.13617 type:complete len:183 (-) Transcript_11758:683-1231(-)